MALKLAVFAVIGAFLGANILIALDEEIVGKGIAFFILLMLLLMLLRKDSGTKNIAKGIGTKRRIAGYLSMLAVGVYGALFGAGYGIVEIYLIILVFGYTFVEGMANLKVSDFAISAMATIIFALNGKIAYVEGIALFAGMFVGGYIGSHYAIKGGDIWLKRLFAVVVAASAIKLLFF